MEKTDTQTLKNKKNKGTLGGAERGEGSSWVSCLPVSTRLNRNKKRRGC